MSKKVPAILYDELVNRPIEWTEMSNADVKQTITSSVYARNVSTFEQHWLAEIPWFQQAGRGAVDPANGTRL